MYENVKGAARCSAPLSVRRFSEGSSSGGDSVQRCGGEPHVDVFGPLIAHEEVLSPRCVHDGRTLQALVDPLHRALHFSERKLHGDGAVLHIGLSDYFELPAHNRASSNESTLGLEGMMKNENSQKSTSNDELYAGTKSLARAGG